MIPFLSPSGPLVARPSPVNLALPPQQHSLGMQTAVQNVAAMGSGAPFHNMPFPPVSFRAPQPADSLPLNYVRNLQGYPREQTGFNQGYFQSTHGSNTGNGLNPDQQDAMGQRDRMI